MTLFSGRSVVLLLLLVPLFGLDSPALDPDLKEITFDLGDGPETFLAYFEPNVTSFYGKNPKDALSGERFEPAHRGMAIKFLNLSPYTLHIYWEQTEGDFEANKGVLTRVVQPLSATGTASFPGHRFIFCNEAGLPLHRSIADHAVSSLHVYDPYDPDNDYEAPPELNPKGKEYREIWKKTIAFDAIYRQQTGRSYLATYPRPRPMHYMHPAQYYGQEHFVETTETHFTKMSNACREGSLALKRQPGQAIDLADHRDNTGLLNMTLKVLSCAPRVFEIQNFLSPVEVEHVLEIATLYELGASTLGDEKHEDASKRDVRTSTNTWVGRGQSPIVDAIYRRAADLMHVDEALMRPRAMDEEAPQVPEGYAIENASIAERLQLVHYDPEQLYTAHHDFAYRPLWKKPHAARFATLLLYLNNDMEGGETSMPRWRNAHTSEPLFIKPQAGKAILFYNQLPDGNMDDLSQHEAHAVRKGEKFLINLWLWDPMYGE